MNDARTKKQIKAEFLRDCGDDDRPEELWKLIWIIRYVLNGCEYPVADQDIADASTVRDLAIDILKEMLQNRDVSAWFTNYPRTDTYDLQEATSSPADIIREIESQWDALGREPTMCEIAAFSARPTEAANKDRDRGQPCD